MVDVQPSMVSSNIKPVRTHAATRRIVSSSTGSSKDIAGSAFCPLTCCRAISGPHVAAAHETGPDQPHALCPDVAEASLGIAGAFDGEPLPLAWKGPLKLGAGGAPRKRRVKATWLVQVTSPRRRVCGIVAPRLPVGVGAGVGDTGPPVTINCAVTPTPDRLDEMVSLATYACSDQAEDCP